jgi:hypothetical protein
MTTNVTVYAIDGPAVIYLQDGSTITVAADMERFVQLIEGGFCTISDAPEDTVGEEEGEHPPPGYILADKMIEFWQGMKDRWQAATGEPEVNPL